MCSEWNKGPKERLALLKKFIEMDENCPALEAELVVRVEFQRKATMRYNTSKQLLNVKGMKDKGFSQCRTQSDS